MGPFLKVRVSLGQALSHVQKPFSAQVLPLPLEVSQEVCSDSWAPQRTFPSASDGYLTDNQDTQGIEEEEDAATFPGTSLWFPAKLVDSEQSQVYFI